MGGMGWGRGRVLELEETLLEDLDAERGGWGMRGGGGTAGVEGALLKECDRGEGEHWLRRLGVHCFSSFSGVGGGGGGHSSLSGGGSLSFCFLRGALVERSGDAPLEFFEGGGHLFEGGEGGRWSRWGVGIVLTLRGECIAWRVRGRRGMCMCGLRGGEGGFLLEGL